MSKTIELKVVRGRCTVRNNKTDYRAGSDHDTFTCDNPKEAAALIRDGVCVKAPGKSKAPVKSETKEKKGGQGKKDDHAELIAAFDLLETDNKEHWTEDGLPEVKALEVLTGKDISAAERDAAWEAYNNAK